jgi:flagellar motor protein MotB
MGEPMTGPANEKNANAVIFVSLYLLLLAFFIFLHSVSVLQEERVRTVLGSVNIAFAGLSRDTPADRQRKLTGEEQGTQAFHAKLKNVFETAVPLVESRYTRGGTRLQFSVPVRQLFAYRSLKLREALDGFLNDVAATMIARNNNVATDIEIRIGTGVSLPELAAVSDDIAAQRVAHLSQRLMDKGVPSRNISIGMEAGDAGLIHFSFFLRPSLTFQFRPEEGAP